MTDRRTDRRTDGRTDGGDCNIPDAFLKKRGDNNCQSHTIIWRPLNVVNVCVSGCLLHSSVSLCSIIYPVFPWRHSARCFRWNHVLYHTKI